MIPYFTLPTPTVAGIQFPWFMILIVVGIAAGTEFARYRAIKNDLSVKLTVDCTLWMVASGFLMAHFVAITFYHPDKLAEDWKNILPWYNFSISSMGGYLGAAIAIPLFLKVWKKAPVFAYTDTLAMGVTLGFAFGRVGCFTAHDHIGKATTFFGGVQFPERFTNAIGEPLGTRHDLGLYEAIFLFTLFGVFLLLDRNKERFHGFYSGLLLVVYGPVRLFFDSLRATDLSRADRRYRPDDLFAVAMEWLSEGGESAVELIDSLKTSRIEESGWLGLTFAQYGAIGLTLLGAWMLWMRHDKGRYDISGEVARDFPGGQVPPSPETDSEVEQLESAGSEEGGGADEQDEEPEDGDGGS
ncbi:MAG: prolipoprotein diacylglyceryl transferase [Proteobacteria bacterium]|nr:prolipoprotein diacylglyceryl transferase [Pseudomonadota bacterium]